MKITLEGGSWDGAGYSPRTQESIYPLIAASFITGCCDGDRTVVASSIMNTSEDAAWLHIRENDISGRLIFSQHLAPEATTNFQFPIKAEGKPFIVISSTPFTSTPVANYADFGATFWTR
jgi:hypothetical protein